MAMHIPTIAVACEACRTHGSPIHGLDDRIGIGLPLAVSQLQAHQRHAETGACTRKRGSIVRAPRCGMYNRGSASGTSIAASESWASDTNTEKLWDGWPIAADPTSGTIPPARNPLVDMIRDRGHS